MSRISSKARPPSTSAASRQSSPRFPVFGYPIGGDRLSVTRGVVSRIDFQPYSHSGVDSHLTIQIDAAINPGNSGGPVLQDGKVVGVAFQGYSGAVAQNVGYMIPTPVIRRFLKDVEDGHYDRYMDLTISYHPLHNPAMRKALGLADNDSGVYVGSVYQGGTSDGHLKQGDVLLAIDNLPIASDGTVLMDGSPVEMAEVVERKFKGDTVNFDVLRGGQQIKVAVPLDHPWPFSLQSNAYDVKPRYVVFGGLVFQPVDADFMAEHNPDDLRLRYYFDHFIAENLYKDHPELVALSSRPERSGERLRGRVPLRPGRQHQRKKNPQARRRRRGFRRTLRQIRHRHDRQQPPPRPRARRRRSRPRAHPFALRRHQGTESPAMKPLFFLIVPLALASIPATSHAGAASVPKSKLVEHEEGPTVAKSTADIAERLAHPGQLD